MRMTGKICYLCNTNVDDASSYVNMFITPLLYDDDILINFMIRELKPMSHNFHSPYICNRCYKLFQMLERAQWIINNVRREISNYQQRTLFNNTDYFLDINQSLDDIQTTKRDIYQTTNDLKHTTDLTYLNYFNINTNFITSHNVKLIDSKDILKEETEMTDSKGLDIIDKYNKKRDLTMENLENDFRKYTFINDNVVKQDIVEKDISNKRCKFCIESFKTNEELNVHLLKHSDTQLYQCSECKEIFINVSFANTHVLNVHSENLNCVNILPVSYKNEIEHSLNDVSLFSQNNAETLNDIKSNICENTKIDQNISEIRDNTASTIDNKVVESTNENDSTDEKNKVNLSSVSWKSKGILNYSSIPFKYTCSVCNKKFKRSSELKLHMKSHSNIKPYMCEICGQVYRHKKALNIHISMHNGISPFQCSFCNKCFTQKGALVRHLPMHTGETQYQCELCGKIFIHHSSYNMHILSHTGKKPYECNICNVSLLSTSHLKRHMRVHTGEKPYSCIECGRRFAQRYNLQSHQKIHNVSTTSTNDTEDLLTLCNQCNSLCQKGHECNEQTKDR